ncbi:hypothetical protein [Haliscomenobacter hydrossis]|uniref:Uncharacterized protein n=1 Tax=Haliscomenobacter hydrossis (strain ATCC 27775 / DSM 1100 / LMG 10767 / O) TaxID=760192 RepID=F4L2W8_HALH1|nr:hypothetical protein [Haliscomenobacter hydrossis]AEE49648.1 hypothetical protein Halhy_1760 [Haliscomenobacter hydrossis DSM 1100]
MKKYPLLIAALLTICNWSCSSKQPPSDVEIRGNESRDTLLIPVIDTTLHVGNLIPSNYRGDTLSSALAEQIVYQYFRKKGYWTQEEVPALLLEGDTIKDVVDFLRLHKIDINHNEYTDAIVEYYLAAPMASGHCIQPHKALLIDSNQGYQVEHEDFIPTDYGIDSVSKNIAFGYDYECANHFVRKYLHITIKMGDR